MVEGKKNIFYHTNVDDIKKKFKKHRITSAIISVIIQMIFFVILSYFFGLYALLALLIGFLLFLPNPLPPAPTEYSITRYGIKIGKKEMKLFNNGNISFKLNEKDNSISAIHRWRGEILKLYTLEPEYLYNLILSLKKDEHIVNTLDIGANSGVQFENQESEPPFHIYLYNYYMKDFYIKIKMALRKNPPIIMLILASILAFVGLISGNITISVTAQGVFNMGLLFWVIWFIYKQMLKRKPVEDNKKDK